ncbi:MAG: DUF4321 domain-containing protein [Candidatus Glassbacteria bacterium]
MLRHERKKLKTYLIVLAIGFLIGGLLSQIFVWVLPDGVVKETFITSIEGSFGPARIDLSVINMTIGAGLRLNIMSVVGVFIASYLFRSFL